MIHDNDDKKQEEQEKEFELLKALFLLNLKNKQNISKTDKELISYYGLESELEDLQLLSSINDNDNDNTNNNIINNNYSELICTDEDYKRINLRANIRRAIDKTLGKVNILFDSISQNIVVNISKLEGEVVGNSCELLAKESIVLSGLGSDRISLEIEYRDSHSYITILGGEVLQQEQPQAQQYKLICFIEKLQVAECVAIFSAGNCPNKLEISDYITNMFRSSDKQFFIATM